ncbi:hypothetical protein SCAR479_11679 [Seiridium cardinale]|uniref:Uncharacterized protein n=1 Tax=Seiridium cardinale TaxID=138064 RepID=A0ABR2XCT3_9PEZI
MTVICGEGRQAFLRLQEKTLKMYNDPEIFTWYYAQTRPTIGPLFWRHLLLISNPRRLARVFAPQAPGGSAMRTSSWTFGGFEIQWAIEPTIENREHGTEDAKRDLGDWLASVSAEQGDERSASHIQEPNSRQEAMLDEDSEDEVD